MRRFETPAGKQAQVNWGHLGSLRSEGGERQMWGFTITLGYSRYGPKTRDLAAHA
ncbi:MAG: hypothetical protein LC130_09935 [Bryobacterales bacterium]|nr:hypothetical protein [Bryobacterales bacterium]MEB2363094.1 hypothetical protein [Bryobacterales bacterium]